MSLCPVSLTEKERELNNKGTTVCLFDEQKQIKMPKSFAVSTAATEIEQGNNVDHSHVAVQI